MKVRILSFFLTLCMVLSVFPAVVFADTAVVADAKTFAELLAESTDGYVKLEQSENIFVEINENITIDLNGHKLTGSIRAPGYIVTVEDSALTGEFAATIVDDGVTAAKLVIKSAGKIAPSLRDCVATTSEITNYTDYLTVKDHSKGTESKYVVNGVSYYYFADALEAAGDNGEITVAASATISAVIEKNLTIVSEASIILNGVEVKDGAKLTIKNSSVTAIDLKGAGTVEFVNVSMSQRPTVVSGEAVKFIANAGYYEFDIPAAWYDATKLVQVGNLLTAKGENVLAYVIFGKDIKAFALETGKFAEAVMAEAVAYAQESGGTLILNVDFDKLIEVGPGNPVTIELNGKVLLGSIINNGNLTIQENYAQGGYIPKVINKKDAAKLTIKGGRVADVENYSAFEFKGGTLNNLHTEGENATFVIYYVGEGVGFISATVEAELTRDNFYENAGLKDLGNSVFEVTAFEAFIGTKGFLKAADAFAAAVEGDTVTLYVDYDGLTVDENLKVELKNGVELTNVTVNAGATLTVPFGENEYAYGADFYALIKAPVAKIGDVYYITLQAAINAVADGVKTTITLVDATGTGVVKGEGIVVPAGKDIVFDFDELTYDVVSGFVGSTGTETNAMQLLKGSKVELTNGKLISTGKVTGANGKEVWAKIMVQNYADSLVVDHFDIDATEGNDLVTYYVLSNNHGNVSIFDSAIVADEGQVAFDVYYSNAYAEGVRVAVTGKDEYHYTTIIGNVEVTCQTGATPANTRLDIYAGKFTGELIVDDACKDLVSVKVQGTNGENKYSTSFDGIDNYEEFYGYFVEGYGPANLEKKADGTYKFDVVANPAYVAEVNGVKYVDLTQAFDIALANGYEVVILADIDTAVVIPAGEKNITLNLGGKTVAGITSNAGVTITVKNGKITDTVTVNSGRVELTSAQLTVVADTLFNIAAGASAAVRLGTVQVYTTTIMTGEGTLSVKNGHWYIADGADLYPYVTITDTVEPVLDADGNVAYYVIKTLTNPVASVFSAEGRELGRYGDFDEAVADALNSDKVVKVLVAGDYVVTLTTVGDKVTVVAADGVNANIAPAAGNTSVYVDVENNVYECKQTKVIVTNGNDKTYYDDVKALESAKGSAEVLVNEALVIGADITDVTVPANFDSKITVVGGPVLVDNGTAAYYATGSYNNLDDYDAVVYTDGVKADVRYDTLADAVAAAEGTANDVDVINDGVYTVSAGKTVVIEGNTYGQGTYVDTKTWQAEIATVRYATVQDALDAASAMGADTIVTVVVDNLVVDALTINAAANHIKLVANGATITTLTATGAYRAAVENAVITTVNETVTDNYSLFKFCTIETLNSATGNLYLHDVEIGTLSLTDTTVNVNFGTTYDVATTVETLVLNGAVKVVVSSPFVVNAIVSNSATVTGKIDTGKYYVTADEIALLVPALPTNYYFQRYDVDGTTYYSPIDGQNIVAEVDGFYYDEKGLGDAVQYAYDNGLTLNIIKTGLTIVLTEKAPVVTLAGEAATVVVDDAVNYFVVQTGATYTRTLIAATVDGVPYASVEDAIDAFTGKAPVVVVIAPAGTVTTDAEVDFVIDGIAGTVKLPAGEYTLTAAALEIKAAAGGYLFTELAYAIDYSVANQLVTVTYLDDEDVTITLDAALAELNVKNNGKGVVTLDGKGVFGLEAGTGKVEIASMDLKFKTNVLLDANVTTAIEGKDPAMLCMDLEASTGLWVLTVAQLSYNGKGFHKFEEAYNAYLASNATANEFTFYAAASFDGTVVFTKDVVVNHNGYNFTVDAIVIADDVTATFISEEDAVATIAVNADSVATAVITVKDNATVVLYNITVKEALKYNTDYSCNSSVALEAGATLAGNNFTVYDLLVDTTNKAPAYLNVDDVCSIDDAFAYTDKHHIYYQDRLFNDGSLVCLNHKMTIIDGKYCCEHCGEEAHELYVTENYVEINVYENGVLLTPIVTTGDVDTYYLFNNDEVTVALAEVPVGMSFLGWSYDHVLKGTIDGVVTMGATAGYVKAEFIVPGAPVQINAPAFSVKGVGGTQYGSAIINPQAGTILDINNEFAGIIDVEYWVNDNGAIVGFGNNLKYTVPANGGSVTAICKATQSTTGSILVIFKNGTDAIGSRIVSYSNYTANNLSTLVIPATPILGTQEVIGWNLDGSENLVDVKVEIAKAIANGENVIKFVPAVKAPEPVNVSVYWDDATEAVNVLANPAVFKTILARNIDGKKLAYWTLVRDGVETNFYTDEIIYKFQEGDVVKTTYVGANEPILRDPTAALYAETKQGLIVLGGVLQLPGDLRIIDAGVIYSTSVDTEEGLVLGGSKVTVKHVTALDEKYATFTLALNAKKVTKISVHARSYMTFVDENGKIVTVYSDITTVDYDANI